MALSANRQINTYQGQGLILDYIVTSAVTVYQGGLYSILLATGFIVVPTSAGSATEQFAGLALEKCVGNGVLKCKFLVGGFFWHAIGSGTVADVGKPVYSASNSDDTITLTGTPGTTVQVGNTIAYDADKALFLIAGKIPGAHVDVVS